MLEASGLNLISEDEIGKIRLQCMRLVVDQTERYTRGKSSSVSIAAAQSIFQSVLYTIGIFLKSLPDADAGLEAIRNISLHKLFEQGNAIITNQIRSARRLLGTVKASRILTDNIAYNDTIDKGLTAFFTAYDTDFAAQETPDSTDYPLYCNKPQLTGIEYIVNYLQTMYLENQFCSKFAAPCVNGLLLDYNDHCRDLLVNIFELVLTNAIGCVLSKKSARQLNLKPTDIKHLQREYEGLSNDDFSKVLKNTSTQICEELDIHKGALQKYLENASTKYAAKLKNAFKNDQLQSVFISQKETVTKPAIKFDDGGKMDDELFSKVTEEIRECRFATDKIAIIKSEIHSIADLVDILEGDYIFDEEFTMVFKSMQDTELALLVKRLPEYMDASGKSFTETENDWELKLIEYLKTLDLRRSNQIREISNNLAENN